MRDRRLRETKAVKGSERWERKTIEERGSSPAQEVKEWGLLSDLCTPVLLGEEREEYVSSVQLGL